MIMISKYEKIVHIYYALPISFDEAKCNWCIKGSYVHQERLKFLKTKILESMLLFHSVQSCGNNIFDV